MSRPSDRPPAGVLRERLVQLRDQLLALQKLLIERERSALEQRRGRAASKGELFRLVLHDDAFAWLRPFTSAIARIDELVQNEQVTDTDAHALIEEIRGFVLITGADVAFGEKYAAAIQSSPEIAWAHGRARALLTW